MEFSITQKSKIFTIKFFLNTLYFLDAFANFPNAILLKALNMFAVTFFLFSLSLNASNILNNPTLKLLRNGVFADIHGSLMGYSYVKNQNVLGVSTKIDFPHLQGDFIIPNITARSAFVADVESGKFLYDLNSTEKLAPASTTKLMTALVSLDIYKLDEILAVPLFCTSINSQRAGFREGDTFSVNDLLHALLISSAGDAACTLATGKIPYADFVDLMNKKASSLEMKNTSFTNPIGLDGVDGSHYSTAQDLYKLAKAAIRSEFIKDTVKTKNYSIASKDTPLFNVNLSNTNKLLWDIPGSIGIKTGKTQEAGEVLIYEYKDKNKDLVIVVMGSQNRFADTKSLLQSVLNSFSWD